MLFCCFSLIVHLNHEMNSFLIPFELILKISGMIRYKYN